MGLALARTMQFWAELIRLRAEINEFPYLLVSATGLVVFFAFMYFGGLWSYREIDFSVQGGPLSFLVPIILMLPLLALFLAISVIAPPSISSATLQAGYENLSRPFFICFAVNFIAAAIPDYLPGVIWHPDHILSILVISLSIALAVWPDRRLHVIGHGIFWVMIIASYGITFFNWLIQAGA